VKWGFEAAAQTMEKELWLHSSERWEEFVGQLDDRYLGFFMPTADKGARVVSNWKLGKELKWFSVEVPAKGWKILAMMDDLVEVSWKLDLAFGYRPFGPEGIQAPRVLLHAKAYEFLNSKKVVPPADVIRSVRLWRFFSEYDVEATDFVAVMKECGLTLEETLEQVKKFFDHDLTSQYREGQYPPYFVNDKKRKEFRQAVRDLLNPMDAWLSRTELPEPVAPLGETGMEVAAGPA